MSVLDLGAGHVLRFTRWAPDRSIPENAERYADVPDVDPCGAIIDHPDLRDPTVTCGGAILFDLPGIAVVFPDHPCWTVESWDPLTISPSVLCALEKGGCGDHGFVRAGQWVTA